MAVHDFLLKIEVSFREKKAKGEITSITSEFTIPYTVVMFSKKDFKNALIRELERFMPPSP